MANRSPYRPPFTISPRILSLVGNILRHLGRLEGLGAGPIEPRLRRENRVRTVRDSLAIEGNTLTSAQVTALLDGRRVIGPRRDVLEIQNAIAAYDAAAALDPASERDLLRTHGILMRGLIEDAGRYRTGAVGVLHGSRVTHLAPPARRVCGLVRQLMGFIRADRETHPLVRSAVVHYELEFIHPFADGNGRIGRLWQHVVLRSIHPLFDAVPFESVIRERQERYYAVLAECDRAGTATVFVEFTLQAVLDALEEVGRTATVRPLGSAGRLAAARAHFGSGPFSRKAYRALLKTISTATASRDLRDGVEQGTLRRTGTTAQAVYCFT